jgi:potassium-dependent mechanosensitive channel
LALREMILDAIGGMAIHAEGTLKVGDWMHVRARDRNIFGRVDSLEWRYVRIQSKDDQVHLIPNSVLLQNVVSNFTSSSGYTRVEIPFRISGTANMADIVQVVTQAVTAEISHEAGVDATRPIKIVCQEISAESVQMSVQVYITPVYSKDTLVTKILMLVSHVLQTNNAIPVMHLSLLNEGRSESV